MMFFWLLACQPLDFTNRLNDDDDGDGYSEFDGDCDDNDPLKNLDDLDGDGTSACDGDCDDNDASLNLKDLDGDGVTTCDGDCRDKDARFQVDNCPRYELVETSANGFLMGSPENEIGREPDETQHRVILTNSYYVMTTEMTQYLFELLMGFNPSEFSDCGGECPVDSVNWHTAAATANAMSDLDELSRCYTCESTGPNNFNCQTPSNPYACEGWRLPTEAEWEHAARFGSEASFWTPTGGGNLSEDNQESCNEGATKLDDPGTTKLTSLAWFCANNLAEVNEEGYGPKPVGQKMPNGYGLYDMHGNVYEWVHDGYYVEDMNYDPELGDYSGELETDPVGYGPDETVQKIVRSGRWDFTPREMRAAERHFFPDVEKVRTVGLRLVRTKK